MMPLRTSLSPHPPSSSLQEVAHSRDGELVTMSSSQPTSPAEHKRRQHPTLEQLETLPVKAGSVGGPPTAAGASSLSSRAPNGLAKLVMPHHHHHHHHEPPPAPPPEDEDQMRLANGVGGDNGLHGEEEGIEEAKEATASSDGSGLSDDEEGAEANNPSLSAASETLGMTLAEFIEHVRAKGRRGLYEEYSEIKNRPPCGTFHHSRAFENQVMKSIYPVLNSFFFYHHVSTVLRTSVSLSSGQESLYRRAVL